MQCRPQNAVQRQYRKRSSITMALYVIALFIAQWVFRRHHPTGIQAYLLAVLPALPIIAMLVVFGLYITHEPDEFERAVVVQSLVWGIGATLAISTIWGFLESFVKTPHVPAYYVYIFFWAIVGIAQPLIRRSYR